MKTKQQFLFMQIVNRGLSVLRQIAVQVSSENFQLSASLLNRKNFGDFLHEVGKTIECYNSYVEALETRVLDEEFDFNSFSMLSLAPLIKQYHYLYGFDFLEAEELLKVIIEGNLDRARDLIAEGAPTDYQELKTGASAMHLAASFGSTEFCDMIFQSKSFDPLITDAAGRLPSELAYAVAGNQDLGDRLAEREVATARQRGLAYSKVVTGGVFPVPIAD